MCNYLSASTYVTFSIRVSHDVFLNSHLLFYVTIFPLAVMNSFNIHSILNILSWLYEDIFNTRKILIF